MKNINALACSICLSLLAAFGSVQARPFTIDDVFRLQDVANARISPDGEWIAYQVRSTDVAKEKAITQLWLTSWSGKVSLQLTQGEAGASDPRWSPDGTQVAFLRKGEGDNDANQVWLLDRRGGEASRLTDLPGGVADFRWSPEGKRFALVHAPKPPVKKDAEGKDIPQPIVIERFQFKSDGDGYLHDPNKERLFLFDIASKRLEALTSGGDFIEGSPSWSPDGQRIAFISNRSADAERGQYGDVFVVDAKPGSTPRQLTDFPGEDAGPLSWSVDGKWLAFRRGDEPKYWLYNQLKLAVVPATGGEARMLGVALDRDIDDPEFAPDGRTVRVQVTDNRIVYPAEIAVSDGKVKRLLSSRSVVRSQSIARGRTVVVANEAGKPAEVYALENGKLRALSSHNQALLSELTLARIEEIDYVAADGQKVFGLLSMPAGASAGQRLPTLLWIHGGPYGQDDYSFDSERELFAANGYAVIQINYRGSNGRGVEFGRGIFADWGNRDVSDLLGGVDHAVKLGVADPQRLVVGGWSQGGILTNYIIAKDHRFKAAISGAGAGNQLSLYGSDQYVFGYEQEFGTPWENTALWLQISAPFFKAGDIRTPTFYVGGQADFNVPIVGSEQMYQALQSRRIPTKLVIYPDEHHGIRRPSFVKDLLGRYLQWYATYLQGPDQQRSANHQGAGL